jgi:hypothetical protein
MYYRDLPWPVTASWYYYILYEILYILILPATRIHNADNKVCIVITAHQLNSVHLKMAYSSRNMLYINNNMQFIMKRGVCRNITYRNTSLKFTVTPSLPKSEVI